MNPKSIISTLNVLTRLVFYISLAFTILMVALWTLYLITGFSGLSDIPGTLVHNVTSFKVRESASDVYLADSTLAYVPVQNQFKMKVSAVKPIGYYSIFIALLYSAVSLAILKGFMNIFKEINLERPFKPRIIKLLKLQAIFFIAWDIISIVHYFIFSQFMQHLAPSLRFSLNIHIGTGIFTGLIIWIIAVVYQRGVELQTENDLTV